MMASSSRVGARAAHALLATALAGVLTYVILAVVSRTVDAAEFDHFSVFWSIALIVGFGVFLPIEQETARLGRHPSMAPTLMPVMLRATVALVALVGALLAVSVPLLQGALGLSGALAWCCVAVVVASGAQFGGRARLLAEGRATAFTNTIIIDSALRVLFFAGVAWAVVNWNLLSPDSWYAVALIAAIIIAHAWALPSNWRPVDKGVQREFHTALAFLICSGLCAQVLVNAGPLIIQALSNSPGLAGSFQASSSLARVPLAMITPVQAMLVGPLAVRALSGDVKGVVASMRSVAVAGAALAVVGAIAGWFVGPWLIDLIFGPGRALPSADIALLIAGVIIHVVLIIFTQAVIATGNHRAALLTWGTALVTAALVFMLSVASGVVLAVEMGFGVGSLTGACVALIALVRSSRTDQAR